MSNTEPLLRLNVEARTKEMVDEIVEKIAAEITSHAGAST
jgi:phosphomannomutase